MIRGELPYKKSWGSLATRCDYRELYPIWIE